uniref:CSON010567 protein n=1 Tax=Culicoides sonorensis TaxID=179676 RepID=A0A336LFR5_CULSO
MLSETVSCVLELFYFVYSVNCILLQPWGDSENTTTRSAIETEINLAANLEADFWKKVPVLQASDVADQIVYLLGTKPNVQISELTIQPIGEKW